MRSPACSPAAAAAAAAVGCCFTLPLLLLHAASLPLLLLPLRLLHTASAGGVGGGGRLILVCSVALHAGAIAIAYTLLQLTYAACFCLLQKRWPSTKSWTAPPCAASASPSGEELGPVSASAFAFGRESRSCQGVWKAGSQTTVLYAFGARVSRSS